MELQEAVMQSAGATEIYKITFDGTPISRLGKSSLRKLLSSRFESYLNRKGEAMKLSKRVLEMEESVRYSG